MAGTLTLGDLLLAVGAVGFIASRIRDAWQRGAGEGLAAKLVYLKGAELSYLSWALLGLFVLGVAVAALEGP